MSGQQRRPGAAQARHGDHTGAVAEQLSREQASEVAEASKHMSLATAGPVDEEIIDPDFDETALTSDEDVTDLTPKAQSEAARQKTFDTSQVEAVQTVRGSAMGKVKAMPRERPRRVRSRGMPDGSPDDEVTIRANGDYPEVTLGLDNHIDFEMGRRYKLPRWMAEHLEEKGMVDAIG